MGVGGVGKTSLMAESLASLQEGTATDKPVFVFRFSAATPGSTDVVFLLRFICEQLKQVYLNVSLQLILFETADMTHPLRFHWTINHC